MAWQSQTQTHDRNRKNEERPERVKKRKKKVVDNLILKKMTLALSYTILVVVISYKVKEV